MAVGDAARAVDFPTVPDTGEDGKVKYGAREINRTRDMVAMVLNAIPAGRAGFRNAAGITSGTDNPSGGLDGDIYFKIVD